MLLHRTVMGDASCFGEVVDDQFHGLVGDVSASSTAPGSAAQARIIEVDADTGWSSRPAGDEAGR